MTFRFSYWSDMTGTSLDESGGATSSWVHALPVGEFKHPQYGKLKFSSDRIQRFVQNIKNNVRGIQLDIDYDHKTDPAKGSKAAGWVRDAVDRPDGLWFHVEWTDEAVQAIRSNQYKYFSAEFVDEWEDATGKKWKDVAFGGAITNRPFMKNLIPLALNELPTVTEGDNVDRVQLIGLLGLSEDATDADIQAKIGQLSQGDTKVDLSSLVFEAKDDGSITVTHPDLEGSTTYTPASPQGSQEDEMAALAEAYPGIKKLLSDNESLSKRLAQVEAANRLSEVTTQLSEIKKDNRVLPPAAIEKFRDVMAVMPKPLSDQVHDALKTLTEAGFVELGERGTTKSSLPEPNENPVQKVLSLIEETQKADDKLTFTDAAMKVAEQNPALYESYMNALDNSSRSSGD